MSRALLAIDGVTKYSSIWIDSIRNGAFGLSNTNKLIRFYPGATGLKTGSTDKAKYCVSASAERNGLKLIAVVLAGESSRDRWNAAKTLLDHGFAGYAFFRPEALAPEKIPVWGGVAPEVTPEAVSRGFLLNKADAVGLESRIELAPSLSAPVEKGQTVGTVQYVKDDRVILELPVTAAEAVPRLSYGGVLAALCRRLLCG
ncbi:MAG: D-alanyl-D-alanine carboxypeptidase, partial [Clostridia bacterium]|nr:D-alanyl-D-alanine carboxypeptidase [Clostridia bacterium]